MEQHSHLTDLAIDSVAAEQIRSIAGWGKFLSIMGFIACGLMLLVGIFAGTIFSSMESYGGGYNSSAMSGMGAMMTAIYVVLAVIFFIPTLFLFQSSAKMKMALNTTDQTLLNEGFMKLKAAFRFWGILTIILLSFYALAFLIGILGASMR